MNFYSQHGEDKWIRENLSLPEPGIFVEVGAFDGVLSSNTLHFEEMGWRGLLIEPDRENAAKCLLNRKADVACCAVGKIFVRHPFFVNPADKGLSGLHREGIPVETPVCPLGALLQVHSIPHVDLLSIDTEGTELDVWESFVSYPYQFPRVVIMEWNTLGLPPNDRTIQNAMELLGYNVAMKTGCNFIFTR